MFINLNLSPIACANLTSSFANECFQIFLCWEYFIICLYSIAAPVYGYIMELATFCSWTGEALLSNLYWPSVTTIPESIYVSSVCVNFSKISIYFCGIILIFFSGTVSCGASRRYGVCSFF